MKEFKKDLKKLHNQIRNPSSPQSISRTANQATINQEKIEISKVNILEYKDLDQEFAKRLVQEAPSIPELDSLSKYGILFPDEIKPGAELLSDVNLEDQERNEQLDSKNEESSLSRRDPLKYGASPELFADVANIGKNLVRMNERDKKLPCLFCKGPLKNIPYDPFVCEKLFYLDSFKKKKNCRM